MAKSSKQVLSFLDDLARRCMPAAREEFSDMEEFAGRKLNAWDMAYYSRAAAGAALQGVAGSAAALLSAAQGPAGTVYAGAAPVRHRCARARRGQRLAPVGALLRSARCRRRTGGRFLPRSVFAQREAQRRLDGRVRDRQVVALGHGLAGRAAGVQFHRARRHRALAAHPRRGDDAVSRVRPRPASHAHARSPTPALPGSTASPGMRSSCRASSWRISCGATRCCR